MYIYTYINIYKHACAYSIYASITQIIGALRISFSRQLSFTQKWNSMCRYLFRPPHMVLKGQVYSEHAPAHTRLDLYAPSVQERAGDEPSPSIEGRGGQPASRGRGGRRVLVFFHGGGYTVSNKASVYRSFRICLFVVNAY